VNGKQVEICRTTHNKTHDDFIRCTKVPANAEICFLDDIFHPGMVNENIYYINVKPYYRDIPFPEMLERFMQSGIGKRLVHDKIDFETKMTSFFKEYNYTCIEKNPMEYEVDEIVGKHIITHLKTFFNDNKVTKSRTLTMKHFKKNKKGDKKKNTTQRR
jgi:succinyl-CoA synthetase beta subunit